MAGRPSMDMLTVDLTDVPGGASRQPGRAVGRRAAGRRRRKRRGDGRLRSCCARSRRACRVVTSERRPHRPRALSRAPSTCTPSSPAPPASSAPISSGRSTPAARPRSSPSTISRRPTSSATSSTATSPTTSTRTNSSRGSPTATSTTTIAAILHQGACSDTMESDGRYMMQKQLPVFGRAARVVPGQRHARFSTRRARRCTAAARHSARSVRARRRSTSTATRSSCSTSTCAACCPSARRRSPGFRYFNVYGPREAAQGPDGLGCLPFLQRSIAPTGTVRLFEGSGGYAAGEQRRDFVAVDDVVAVNLDFLDASRAQRHLQPRHGRRVDVQRSRDARRSTRARGGAASRRLRFPSSSRAARSVRAVPARARRQVPELHPGRSHRVCAPPAIARR